MATGLNDWWRRGSIDVIAQTLAAVYNRPTYGGMGYFHSSGLNLAGYGSWVQIFGVAGVGKIYGGCIHFWGHNDAQTAQVKFVIDSMAAITFTVVEFATIEAVKETQGFLYYTQYSPAGVRYTLGVMPDMTFETGVYISVQQTGVNNVWVRWCIPYAVV